MTLLRHMLDNGLLVTSHGDARNVRLVDCHEPGSPLIDTRPWLLAFTMEGPGRDMARLRGAIGERRIDETIAKAEAHLEKGSEPCQL